jgi:acetyl-CoA C-acetyltransferase
MKQVLDDTTPIIVGIGEFTYRDKDPSRGLEPIQLMERAVRAASNDSGLALEQIDSLDVVSCHSWPYTDPPRLLAERLGCKPAQYTYGETGGETPVRFIHEAALRIATGEARVAVVVGAEARYTADAATNQGVSLNWTPRDDRVKVTRGADFCKPVALRLGASKPPVIYPFYENATLARWGQTPQEAHQESSELWSRYSEVAAANPHAWRTRAFTPEEVATPTADNRLIAWPYPKRMVANPSVNMAAAVMLTSVGHAREAGIPEASWVYIWGGASASEPRDFLERDQYYRSHAQDVVLETVLAQVGGDASAFEMLELYSCFPVVSKMARRTLGLAPDAKMTATGGLSFFGAPMNNYMTHAAAGLVRALRSAPNKAALLYGQGEYVTKHHALILGSRPSPSGLPSADYSVQKAADARRAHVPLLVTEHEGAGTVETFTVVYGRSGSPSHGIVIARTDADTRLMARVDPTDTRTIQILTDAARSPVGLRGSVTFASGELHWTAAA